MAIPGGDAGRVGVVRAPQLIGDAKTQGSVPGRNDTLWDTKKGEILPDGVTPMPLPTDADPKALPEPATAEVARAFAARCRDIAGRADRTSARVFGAEGLLRGRPVLGVRVVSRAPAVPATVPQARMTVLLPIRGQRRIDWRDGATIVTFGDAVSPSEGDIHGVASIMSGEPSLCRVVATEDTVGPKWHG